MRVVVSVHLPQHGGPIFPRVVEAAEERDGGETLPSPKYRASFKLCIIVDPVEFFLRLLVRRKVDINNHHGRRMFGKRER